MKHLSKNADSIKLVQKRQFPVPDTQVFTQVPFAEAMTNRSQIGAGEQQLGTTKQTV